jgi:dissimilatory sulfite reductase (desulfoviridin) alpha/beta subunit
VVALVSRIVESYKANALSGERLGALVNRLGWDGFREAVMPKASF